MNYESLDDWASHTVDSWELSEINATISTNRFQTDSGFQGIWVTKKYSGFMGANSFDYFIAIDLSTNAWKQRHMQNEYTEESDWLRVEFSGGNTLTNENEFPTALAVAKSFDYNESFVPEIETYQEIGQDTSSPISLARSFVDGPISFETPSDTLIDLYRSYSENGSWTQAHYLPGLNNEKFPSFIINSYTEMNYESLDDWASHTVDSWELSEINATISTNRFQTDSGFQGIWVTKKYSGFMGANSFDYFIAIDLSTNAWKQRHMQNEYTEESDWLRVEFSGGNTLTNENEFPTALAVAKSFDYNESFVPEIETYQEIGQDTSSPISLARSFVDGPISFETPSDTLIDLYRSYSENGSWTQAHYLPGLNNEKFPSFIINSYTEMNYESLDDWASHTVDSWELSEINATISTNRFQTDSGFQGIWVTKKYSGFMGANSFDYFIAIDLSTNAWKQRHMQNEYTEESDWLRVEFSGGNTLTNENEFPTALAVAKSFDYNESFVPVSFTYVTKSSDLSASTKLLVTDLDSGWFLSDWFGFIF